MAILSFAHLKNKNGLGKPVSPSGSISGQVGTVRQTPVKSGGVMSFAHMKKQKPVQEAQGIELPTEPQRTSFRIPAVLPTALLASVNYCFGCERFLATTKEESKVGDQYGRCLRKVDPDSGLESWKVIPANAKVSRCFFNIT